MLDTDHSRAAVVQVSSILIQVYGGVQNAFDMNDGCLFSRRLAWSARILASHNMGTNDAPVRLRRTSPYRTLIDELQRHARHVGLFLSHRERKIVVLRVG